MAKRPSKVDEYREHVLKMMRDAGLAHRAKAKQQPKYADIHNARADGIALLYKDLVAERTTA